MKIKLKRGTPASILFTIFVITSLGLVASWVAINYGWFKPTLYEESKSFDNPLNFNFTLESKIDQFNVIVELKNPSTSGMIIVKLTSSSGKIYQEDTFLRKRSSASSTSHSFLIRNVEAEEGTFNLELRGSSKAWAEEVIIKVK